MANTNDHMAHSPIWMDLSNDWTGYQAFWMAKHEQANSSLTRLNGFIEQLNGLLSFLNGERMIERLTHPFKWVYRKTEQVIKFFEQLTQKGKWLTNQFKRLIKIFKWVPQMTERLTQTIISQNMSHFTRGCPVSPGMKLLLHHINNNYCLRTCISIWDCNFSKNYIRKTPHLC